MSFEIEFKKHPTYIHATITGINGREVVMQYLDKMVEECAAQDCFRVLIEERLDGPRLDAMDVFALVSKGSMRALGQFEAIAYVDESMGEMAEFAETVAVNRGMPLAAFPNVARARQWLEEQKAGPSEQYIFWNRDSPN